MKKKAFTIIEMIMVISIIAIWMMGIISVIDHWVKYAERTRKNIIAINIARSWVEEVFNIRDTNWLRWSAKKYQCWLKTDPLNDWWDWNCDNDTWMWSGSYILSWKTNTIWQKFFVLSWANWELNIKKSGNFSITATDKQFALCNNWKWFWDACPWTDNPNPEWRFFMMIKGLWVFDKSPWSWWPSGEPNQLLSCPDWTICWNDRPMEYRFCAVVQYVWEEFGETQLCSVMTNFMKQE